MEYILGTIISLFPYTKITYKRLVVKYFNPESERTFFRGFGINDIVNNPYWYIPNPRNHSGGGIAQR